MRWMPEITFLQLSDDRRGLSYFVIISYLETIYEEKAGHRFSLEKHSGNDVLGEWCPFSVTLAIGKSHCRLLVCHFLVKSLKMTNNPLGELCMIESSCGKILY